MYYFLLQQKVQKPSELSTIVADKVAVRNYVSDVIGDWILIPLCGTYKSANEIDLDPLPEKFIIKTNHGSGWNLICRDKSAFNLENHRSKLNSWLKRNAYYLSREKQYRGISSMLIVEELISDEPNDYKFFCYKGKVKAIQVDTGRFTNHERTIYDTSWSAQNIRIRYSSNPSSASQPVGFNKMIEVAERLSKPFEFARIDLYETNQKIYFGEITLCPGGAVEPFLTFEEDVQMSKLVFD